MDDDRDIRELKTEVAASRDRLRNDLEQVRSAADPREVVRNHPYVSLGAAAAAGALMASAILPPGRGRPLSALIGGCLNMAYRGFFMAATPVFAKHIADLCVAVKNKAFSSDRERIG